MPAAGVTIADTSAKPAPYRTTRRNSPLGAASPLTSNVARDAVTPSWMRHIGRDDEAIEIGFVHVTQFERRLLEILVLVVGFFRDLRGLVVADVGSERRHQHQGFAQMTRDDGLVRDEIVDEVFAE